MQHKHSFKYTEFQQDEKLFSLLSLFYEIYGSVMVPFNDEYNRYLSKACFKVHNKIN